MYLILMNWTESKVIETFMVLTVNSVMEVTGKSGTLMNMLFPDTSEFMVVYHPLFGGSREESLSEVFERDCSLYLRVITRVIRK